MSSAGRFEGLCATPDTPAAHVAELLSWLWGFPDPVAENAPGLVRLAPSDAGAEVRRAVSGGRLGAAIVIRGDRPDAADPGASPSRRVEGSPSFDGSRVAGEFRLIDATPGEFGVASSLGTHATWSSGVLDLAAPDDLGWGTLRSFWALEAVSHVLGTPRRLPAVGCLRLDDFPGTAQHQAQGNAKEDAKQLRRLSSLRRACERSGSVLNFAVAAEALDGGARVPLDRVWPRCIEQLGDGVRAGRFEPVCHGLLHLDPDLYESSGEIEFREFAALSHEEAGRRIDLALAWHEAKLARPRVFVAPAWGYSEGSIEALAERGLPAWLPPRPGPLADGPNLRETLTSDLIGLHRLDYSPLARLAAVGVPPTVTFHGGLIDSRTTRPRDVAGAVDLARLLLARDIVRVPRIAGVDWIGAGDFAELIAGHRASG
ncbi:hypothetical protein HJD18_06990 [Thermoleophilia bacterium SCSIO 60948]|nr:hypothetical protein HJD18_06990 [Thermoleophilia bacterium SCSIO 60948]